MLGGDVLPPGFSFPMIPEFDRFVQPTDQTGVTQDALNMVNAEFPLPPQVHNAMQVPGDVAHWTTEEIRRGQIHFNAQEARAIALLAAAEGYANDAKLFAETRMDALIGQTSFPAKTTVKQMEAWAISQDPEIQTALKAKHQWNEIVRQLKARRDIAHSTAERLSREQTGREAEQRTTPR